MLSGPRFETATSLDAIHSEWSELSESGDNVFGTWEWASTWWRHFGGGRTLLVRLCRTEEGRPSGILPFYLSRERPLRVLRFLGHGPADELGPVGFGNEPARAAEALRRSLGDVAWDVLLCDQLRSGRDWAELLGGRTLSSQASPVLHAPEGWDAFVATRSANFREQVGRRERRLAREHKLGFRLSKDPERLQRDLDTLFALHHAVRPRSDFGPERFHRQFATVALERGWLRLWLLELDGKPAAAWYGFRFAGVETYYQSGRDPAFEPFSVGFVLNVHTIRSALEDGVREYRFGRGAESYKYRFATEDAGLETIAVTRRPVLGFALGAAQRVRRIAHRRKRG